MIHAKTVVGLRRRRMDAVVELLPLMLLILREVCSRARPSATFIGLQ